MSEQAWTLDASDGELLIQTDVAGRAARLGHRLTLAVNSWRAAVTWAEEKDVSHVTAITASSSRDTQRFLARLGLAPVAMVRVANTALLRHKLTPEAIRPLDRGIFGSPSGFLGPRRPHRIV